MTDKLKEHDTVRLKGHTGTLTRGTIILLRDDGSCVIELFYPSRIIDTHVDRLEKE